MKNKILLVASVLFLTLPCALRAEEMEIPLMEISQMGNLPSDTPLDGPDISNPTPTRPNDFRATVDGRTLSVSIEEPAITGAQLRVYKQGGLVVNRFFSSATAELLTAGSYSLEIETDGGLLVGTFDVE
ncbi:MAG: hypothetical protein IJ204_06890 [Paludibacteraceae bacterium]|nr:hypothetical protein [Paludibacteraceae bacterium]